MSIFLNNVNDITGHLVSAFLKEGGTAADMTMGNGHDTLKLLEATGEGGKVYAFDVQEKALENTRNLLGERKNVILIRDSHENVDRYITEELDLAVYNLGYLPGAEKDTKTEAESTTSSLRKVLKLIKTGGHVIISVYTGHEGGMEENEAILDFLLKLNKKKYNALKLSYPNRKDTAPKMMIIEKISR